MKLTGVIFLFFGLLLIAGGMMGYSQAGSIASIVAGIFLGISLIILSVNVLRGSALSENIALVTTLFIDIFFSYRLLKAKAFMPAGLMTVIASAVIIAVCISIKKRLSKTLN